VESTTVHPIRRKRDLRGFLRRLIVIAFGLISADGCRPGAADGDKVGATNAATVAVETFATTDSGPKDWNGGAFADSLATRLGLMNVVTVVRHPDARKAGTDFALLGDVSLRNGRLVLGVRLWHGEDPAPSWTATFWRSEGPMSRLVDDVATGAAEALGAEIARMSVSKGPK
jgi:hypothetical protein